MEKFDLQQFKSVNTKKEGRFITAGDQHVLLRENSDSFQKDVRKPNSPLVSRKIYFKDSLHLQKEGEFLHEFPVGIHRTYDQQGKLCEEINFDSPFSFSIDSVYRKIVEQYGKNIMDTQQRLGVWRSVNPYPHYIISIPLSKNPKGDTKSIKINGETGEIESEKILTYTK